MPEPTCPVESAKTAVASEAEVPCTCHVEHRSVNNHATDVNTSVMPPQTAQKDSEPQTNANEQHSRSKSPYPGNVSVQAESNVSVQTPSEGARDHRAQQGRLLTVVDGRSRSLNHRLWETAKGQDLCHGVGGGATVDYVVCPALREVCKELSPEVHTLREPQGRKGRTHGDQDPGGRRNQRAIRPSARATGDQSKPNDGPSQSQGNEPSCDSDRVRPLERRRGSSDVRVDQQSSGDS